MLGSLFLALAAVVFSGPAVAEDARLALVIGNGAYPSGPLSSPEKDGPAVAAKLKGLGFAVTEKLNLKRDELLSAVREFGERLAQHPGTVGLFYYSGHGMSVNSRNYIIPIDANIHSEADVELYAVAVENVLLRMTMAQDKANIIILDACRDNPFEKRWKSSSGGLAPINDEPAGTLIAYAAAPGHTAEAGMQGSLSKYTEALVKLIDQPAVNLIEMFQEVQNAVYRGTQGGNRQPQQPYLEISPGLPTFSFNERPPSNERPSGPKNAALDPVTITRLLQGEMRRVGCYTGPVNGIWDAKSSDALNDFNRREQTSFDITLASLEAFQAVSERTRRVCPLVCSSGQTAIGDRCEAAHQIPTKPAVSPGSPRTPPAAPVGKRCDTWGGQTFCE